MERRRLTEAVLYLGLACMLGISITVWAQVGAEPKRGDKAVKPAADPGAETEKGTVKGKTAAPASRESAAKASEDPAPRPAARDNHGTPARDDRRANANKQGGGWLGVYVAESQAENGVTISQIFPASPAARAGFRTGDVITQINDQKVADPQAFVNIIEAMPPQTKATFTVQRNNQPVQVIATLGQNYWSGRGQNRGYDTGFEGQRFQEEEEFPMYAMELEHNRRMAEQHQRIEQMILELREEVHQLREELMQRK